MGVYHRIDELRKSKGIKWNYLNEKLPGAYHGRMTELKNGKTTLNGEQLDAIAEILGTTSAYLLGATDDPNPAGQKEGPVQIVELNEKDARLIKWFRSLPPEKQRAILIAQDGPEDAAE